MYRSSEENCTGHDSPPEERRHVHNREGWEVLSQSASELLMTSLQPRAIFSGHTHHSCHVMHPGNVPEFTLPSFSWRNRNDPSFVMVSDFRVFPNLDRKQCFLVCPSYNSYFFFPGDIQSKRIFGSKVFSS